MVRIIKEDVETAGSLEMAKRQILALHRQLVQDGKLSQQLDINFSVVDTTLADIIEELESL